MHNRQVEYDSLEAWILKSIPLKCINADLVLDLSHQLILLHGLRVEKVEFKSAWIPPCLVFTVRDKDKYHFEIFAQQSAENRNDLFLVYEDKLRKTMYSANMYIRDEYPSKDFSDFFQKIGFYIF